MITLEKRDVTYLYLNLKSKYMGINTCTPEEIYDFSRKLMDNKDIDVLVIEDSISSSFVNNREYISIDEKKMDSVNHRLQYIYLKLFSIISSGYLENIFLQVLKTAILKEEEKLESQKARWNELSKEFFQDKHYR